MDWKNEKLRSALKMNKEKLIFLFCSGLLLFLLAFPADGRREQKEAWEAAAQGIGAAVGTDTGGEQDDSGTVSEAGAVFAAPSDGSYASYEEGLEQRIRTILSGVEGVGAVDVMVVLKSTEEKVIRIDRNTSSAVTEDKAADGTGRVTRQQELSENTVFGDGDSSPVVEKQLLPEISGIIVSADGGGSAVVKTEISEAMEALFGLPSHKIKVLKRVKEGA